MSIQYKEGPSNTVTQTFFGRPGGFRQHIKDRVKHWHIPFWRFTTGKTNYTFTHPQEGESDINEFVGYGKGNALGLIACGKYWSEMEKYMIWVERLKGKKQIVSEKLVKKAKRK